MAATSTPQGPVSGRSSVVAGLLLIAAGLVALAGNYLPGDRIGALLFLGLGGALLAARVVTGRYGYAPPAGVLLGFGAFVALETAGALPADEGGAFFLLLAAGFAAVYAIGGRLDRTWPLYPAAVLAAIGAVLAAAPAPPVLTEYLWLGRYWPAALLALGLWVLLGPRVPPLAHRLIGLMLLVAVLAFAAVLGMALAAYYAPAYGGPRPDVRAFAPFVATSVLEAPMAPGGTLRVVVTSGNVVVRPGRDGEVRADVVRLGWTGEPAPEPRLVAGADAVTLVEPAPATGMHHHYRLDVPRDARVEVRSASGDVDLDGITGPVGIVTASGDVRLGVPAGRPDAHVTTASGDVRARLVADTSAQIDLRTFSGDVDAPGLDLRRAGLGLRTYAGAVGGGSGRLAVETASGDVHLELER